VKKAKGTSQKPLATSPAPAGSPNATLPDGHVMFYGHIDAQERGVLVRRPDGSFEVVTVRKPERKSAP
jgi:hypothetical protein